MTVAAVEPDHFPWLDYQPFTFALAITHDRRAWYSGHTASQAVPTAKGIRLLGGTEEQLEVVFEKLKAIDAGSGVRLGGADVVLTVYVPSRNWPADRLVRTIRQRVLELENPPRALKVHAVLVDRLIRSTAELEIEATADSRDEIGERTWIVEPVSESGDVLHAGDFDRQYRQCEVRLRHLLEEAGLTDHAAVKVMEFHSGGQGTKEAEQARRAVWPDDRPVSSSVWLTTERRPGSAVSLMVTTTNAPTRRFGDGPEPWAVTAEGIVHLAGLTVRSTRDEHGLVGAAVRAYDQLGTRLAELPTPSRLVRTNEWVTIDALPAYREFGDVRRSSLSHPWPAAAGMICRSVGGPEDGAGVVLDCTATEVLA